MMRHCPGNRSTVNAHSTMRPMIGIDFSMQIHSQSFPDRELPLTDAPRELAEEGDMPRAHPLQDLQRLRKGGGREDSLLLQREKHGASEVLLD